MFVYSLRATTIKFFAVVCVALVTLITLITFIPDFDDGALSTNVSVNEDHSFNKVKTNVDRIAFIKQFGWTVLEDPIESVEITIPSSFDKIFEEYNEIQKQQGLDLTKYKNKEMMRYTYKITNYKDYDGVVYITLLVYRNKVVGGDVCSEDVKGFIHGFSVPQI